MEITFEDVIPFDQFEIVKDECFPEEKIDSMAFESNIEKANFIFAMADDIPSGYIFYTHTQIAKIIQLCVNKSYRQHGIGRKLIEKLMIRLAEFGSQKVILNVHHDNLGAIKFYHKLGFSKTGHYFRYICDLDDLIGHHRQATSERIQKITSSDEEMYARLYHIGSFQFGYYLQSKISNCYSIFDDGHKIQGYVIIDNKKLLIEPMGITNPQILISAINQLAKEEGISGEVGIEFHDRSLIPYLTTNLAFSREFYIIEMGMDI